MPPLPMPVGAHDIFAFKSVISKLMSYVQNKGNNITVGSMGSKIWGIGMVLSISEICTS